MVFCTYLALYAYVFNLWIYHILLGRSGVITLTSPLMLRTRLKTLLVHLKATVPPDKQPLRNKVPVITSLTTKHEFPHLSKNVDKGSRGKTCHHSNCVCTSLLSCLHLRDNTKFSQNLSHLLDIIENIARKKWIKLLLDSD